MFLAACTTNMFQMAFFSAEQCAACCFFFYVAVPTPAPPTKPAQAANSSNITNITNGTNSSTFGNGTDGQDNGGTETPAPIQIVGPEPIFEGSNYQILDLQPNITYTNLTIVEGLQVSSNTPLAITESTSIVVKCSTLRDPGKESNFAILSSTVEFDFPSGQPILTSSMQFTMLAAPLPCATSPPSSSGDGGGRRLLQAITNSSNRTVARTNQSLPAPSTSPSRSNPAIIVVREKCGTRVVSFFTARTRACMPFLMLFRVSHF
jgi:hypothetical protein